MTPAFTYWTTGKGTRTETSHRRCTTCGSPESYRPGDPPRRPCPYKALHKPGPPQYTGRTPST